MSEDQKRPPPAAVEELEQEVLRSRKFSPTEAMARMAGPGAMKGASPISRQQQAEIEVGRWISSNVADPGGALECVLHRHIKGSDFLLTNLDHPLAGLAAMCEEILGSAYRLQEIVREADVEWGQRMDERPRFERDGMLSDPADPYTIAWVREALCCIVTDIRCAAAKPQ